MKRSGGKLRRRYEGAKKNVRKAGIAAGAIAGAVMGGPIGAAIGAGLGALAQTIGKK